MSSGEGRTYSVSDAARYYQRSTGFVRDMRKAGALPDRRYWTKAELDAALSKLPPARVRGKPKQKKNTGGAPSPDADRASAPSSDASSGAGDAPPTALPPVGGSPPTPQPEEKPPASPAPGAGLPGVDDLNLPTRAPSSPSSTARRPGFFGRWGA